MVTLFGRTITYSPYNRTARSISAIVDYPGPGSIGQLDGGSRPHVEILVANDSSTGIASTEVDTGGDKVTVPMRIGITSRVLRIVEIMGQDDALLCLRCL